MDPLSDVLRALRLNGAHFFSVEATHPWSVAALAARALRPRVLPDAEHLISYHILVSGTAWAGLEGEPHVRMEPGDVVVFPRGDAHLMSGDGRRVSNDVLEVAPPPYPATVRLGRGAGERASLVCGFLGCDARPFGPLLAALPRRLLVRGAAGAGKWLAEFPRQVMAEVEAQRAGSATMLARMAELMFMEVRRHHVESQPAWQTGWLAALRDPVVAPALAQLHERPSHAWTLAELARTIATSRTVLAERFAQVVGVPPMQYLTQWRLQLAAEQLASGSAKVAAVGASVGYESEAAFSRAFKRMTGHAPATWRRARR